MKRSRFIAAFLLLSAGAAHAQTLDWARTYGGAGHDWFRDMFVGPDGAVYSRGAYVDTTDLDPGPGLSLHAEATWYSTFIQKLDADGDFVWGLSIPQGWQYPMEQNCFAFDPAGYLFNSGPLAGPVDVDPGPGVQTLVPAGAGDVYVQRFDTAGNLLWVRQLSNPAIVNMATLAYDGSGGVWAYMTFQDSLDVDPGPGTDFLVSVGHSENNALVHFDAQGNVVGVGRTGWLKFFRMHAADNGDVYISGLIDQGDTIDVDPGPGVHSYWTDNAQSVFLLRLDPQGDLIWLREIQQVFGASDAHFIECITTDGVGNVYATGYFWNEMDLDPGPGVSGVFSAGGSDAFIWKLDAQGDLVAAYAFGGPQQEHAFFIEVGPGGDMHVVGGFQDVADLDPGPWVQAVTSQAYTDGFYLHLSPTGQYYTSAILAGTGTDIVSVVRLDDQENVYLGGYFGGTTDLDPGMGTLYTTALGTMYDALVIRLNPGEVSVAEEGRSGPGVYPNPADDLVWIVDGDARVSTIWDLHDLSGRRVATTRTAAGRAVLDVKHLPGGVYVLSDREGRLAPQRVVVR